MEGIRQVFDSFDHKKTGMLRPTEAHGMWVDVERELSEVVQNIYFTHAYTISSCPAKAHLALFGYFFGYKTG